MGGTGQGGSSAVNLVCILRRNDKSRFTFLKLTHYTRQEEKTGNYRMGVEWQRNGSLYVTHGTTQVYYLIACVLTHMSGEEHTYSTVILDSANMCSACIRNIVWC